MGLITCCAITHPSTSLRYAAQQVPFRDAQDERGDKWTTVSTTKMATPFVLSVPHGDFLWGVGA
jgi:hypothetical protein